MKEKTIEDRYKEIDNLVDKMKKEDEVRNEMYYREVKKSVFGTTFLWSLAISIGVIISIGIIINDRINIEGNILYVAIIIEGLLAIGVSLLIANIWTKRILEKMKEKREKSKVDYDKMRDDIMKNDKETRNKK